MKKYFTKEQIERLKSAEQHFRTVVRAAWKRGTTRAMNDLVADIYQDATGERLNRDWACGRCTYDVYLKVGRLYFESIEHLPQEEEEDVNEIVLFEVDEVRDEEPKDEVTTHVGLESNTENQEVSTEQSQIKSSKRGRPKSKK